MTGNETGETRQLLTDLFEVIALGDGHIEDGARVSLRGGGRGHGPASGRGLSRPTATLVVRVTDLSQGCATELAKDVSILGVTVLPKRKRPHTDRALS